MKRNTHTQSSKSLINTFFFFPISYFSTLDLSPHPVAVVVAFFVCWAPFHAQRLMAIYVQSPTSVEIAVFTVLTYISGVSYYVSATINPILYSIMSNKFRQAFKDTLGHGCCGRKGQRASAISRFGKLDGSGYSSRAQFANSLRNNNGRLSQTDMSTCVASGSRTQRASSCVPGMTFAERPLLGSGQGQRPSLALSTNTTSFELSDMIGGNANANLNVNVNNNVRSEGDGMSGQILKRSSDISSVSGYSSTRGLWSSLEEGEVQ